MSCALEIAASDALGIGAASFCSEAEKDIAESPTAIAGTPKEKTKYNSQQTTDFGNVQINTLRSLRLCEK